METLALATMFIFAVIAAIAMIVLTTLSATSLLSPATVFAIRIAEHVATDIQLLTALALTPSEATLMIAVQTGSLVTLTQLMQELNLVMIAATV